MDIEKQKEVFEDKYQSKLGMGYDEWLDQAPETEDQAYEKLAEIDKELKQLADALSNSQGGHREELEDERDRLKLEYDIIEEMFGLELD